MDGCRCVGCKERSRYASKQKRNAVGNGKAYPTGKILVTATVTIPGIGSKESTGENWSDEDNALTRAQAQSKKRALSEFGLGAYFYELDVLGENLWGPLDRNGRPSFVPKLPEFALPYAMRTGNTGPTPVEETTNAEERQQTTADSPKAELMVVARQGEVIPPSRKQPTESRQSTQPPLGGAVPAFKTDDEYVGALHSYATILGNLLVENIVRQYASRKSEFKGEKFDVMHCWLESAVSLLGKTRAAVALEPEKAAKVLEHYGVDSVGNFLTWDALKMVAQDLGVDHPSAQRAAA